MDEYTIKRREAMKEMQLEARAILDQYNYDEFILACEEGEGPKELNECLRNILFSIIEDWIQDYANERELIHMMENLTIS